jgi:erythronate-4-phosphate dehydrogenase
VVTLHTPLIDDGPFPTRHLADHRFFEYMQPGSLFINACRGEVVDSDALLTAMDAGIVRAAVLDVWENEPRVRRDVLDRVDLGSAHIAGYSFEGKLNGTLMVYEDACQFFELPSAFDASKHAPEPAADPIVVDGRGRLAQDILHQAVRRAYDIRTDDQLLRSSPAGVEGGAYFNGLRRGYRLRREFPCLLVQPRDVGYDVQQTLERLGFVLHRA